MPRGRVTPTPECVRKRRASRRDERSRTSPAEPHLPPDSFPGRLVVGPRQQSTPEKSRRGTGATLPTRDKPPRLSPERVRFPTRTTGTPTADRLLERASDPYWFSVETA